MCTIIRAGRTGKLNPFYKCQINSNETEYPAKPATSRKSLSELEKKREKTS